jgi:EmrB/QacA subfamily drug resistance transporter
MIEELDPKRWLTLAIVLIALVIVVVDNTVLTVAIPTIIRDLHSTLPSVQWVMTGYSLTFATLLIIGGRLGDLYGARRTFIVGAAFFGVGSLVASIAQSVPQLIVGEAVIEGIGAAMMMPATLAILSNTFRGRERATAFAAWGAVAGGAVAFGPVLGGYLTTYHSWRWAFRINVIVAPLAVVGAILFMRRDTPTGRHERLDLPGAVLVAIGAFSLVFGISQAGTYGWWHPLADASSLWPASRPVSVTPLLFVLSALALTAFVRVDLAKERRGDSPLFEFGQLRHKCFRYGLVTSITVAMGQLGMLFVLPVFLQDGKQLSAIDNGLWLVPMGIAILVAAQVGGRLTRVLGTTSIVRFGLIIDAVGLVLMGVLLRPGVSFFGLLPATLLFGIGVGLASSQLTNVILYDIDPDKAGVASGANSTVRQVGSALGVALVGSVLSSQIISHATAAVRDAALPAAIRETALAQIRRGGVNLSPTSHPPLELRHALESAVAAASRPSLLLAAGIVAVGAALSFLIPPVDQRRLADEEVALDLYDVAEPVDTHTVH